MSGKNITSRRGQNDFCIFIILNWPRKKGPSTNFDKKLSILSRAATDHQKHSTNEDPVYA
jgi:hypothetical protein